jgi:hypothetical protein
MMVYGSGRVETGELLLNGNRVSVVQDEKGVGMDGDGDITT